jgi:UrcA family protein
MNSFRAAILTTVTVFGIACSTAIAGVESSIVPPSVTVKYADLDVHSDQGASMLYARLRSASRQVCANFEGRTLRQRTALKNCFQQALAKAVTNLNVERLTALHQRKLDRAS